MRVYTVQHEGETAASIAAKDEHAGCPKCGKDLVNANPHRVSVRRENGYLDFRDPLVPGERLWLPERWFDGSLDREPRSYFDALPDPMGLGALPPHVPQRYMAQPGDSAASIAAKFQSSPQPLVQENPHVPSTTLANGELAFCNLTPGTILTLPGAWFAPGSTWSAISLCSAPAPDASVSPEAAAQYADANHPPPKDITLSVHPSAIATMQSAQGGSRDTTATLAQAAAGASTVAGMAMLASFAGKVLQSVAMREAAGWVERLLP